MLHTLRVPLSWTEVARRTGSVVATVLWVIISLGFKFYVSQFGSYTATYGAIGGVIVTLVWLYVSSLAVLIGAELNAEIEHSKVSRHLKNHA
jgi:membrane protein